MSSQTNPAPKPWPYPRWIAHRGAGKLAPENTLGAFRMGSSYGYRMFECDVKLSADSVPFLLHDATLARTTNGIASGSSTAGDHTWSALSRLDAGSWHSRGFAGETIPTLEAIARFCLRNGHLLNIEIKATPGTELQTGEVVARHAATLWKDAPAPPLLTSFDVASLEGAQAVAPDLPRGLLLEKLWDGWLERAMALRCVAVVCDHILWDQPAVDLVHQRGMRALSYTVNDTEAVQRLIRLGTDGIITDRVDLFSPT
jgi:glycerophosphoryl diester phosphodiesterase